MRKIAAQYLYPLTSQPIRRGFLSLHTDGTILEIGKLEDEVESTEFYNGILCPGFVNSHCHVELSHLKGSFTQDSGMAGFFRQINQLRNSVDEKERKAAIEKEMEQLYNSGVSAIADISNCSESFETKSISKIYTRTFLEVFGTEAKDAPFIMQRVRELTRKAKAYGIDAAPNPHSCCSMSTELLRESCSDALNEGWLSFHSQESWEEEELAMNGTGPLADEYKSRGLSTLHVIDKSALLYFLNILKSIKGSENEKIQEQILLVHNTFTNEVSIDAATGLIENLFWAICPLSNIFIHRALPPIDLLRRKGANITLGTDSLSSNAALSIVEEIKAIHKYFPNIPLEEILQWASLNGAKFLKKENELGSFEVGKRPGIVLVDNIDWQKMKLTDESHSVRLI